MKICFADIWIKTYPTMTYPYNSPNRWIKYTSEKASRKEKAINFVAHTWGEEERYITTLGLFSLLDIIVFSTPYLF